MRNEDNGDVADGWLAANLYQTLSEKEQMEMLHSLVVMITCNNNMFHNKE